MLLGRQVADVFEKYAILVFIRHCTKSGCSTAPRNIGTHLPKCIMFHQMKNECCL